MAAAVRALSLSFALLLAALGAAQGVEDFRKALERAETLEQVKEAIAAAPPELENDNGMGLQSILELGAAGPAQARDAILHRLEMRERVIQPRTGSAESPKAQAQDVLQNPAYQFRESREQGWLGQAFQRIFSALEDWIRGLARPQAPNLGQGFGLPAGLDRAVVTLIMVLLGGVLVGFLVFAIRRFQLQKRRSSRVGGLLSADEEELTADSWLQQADRLEKAGQHREAVRCLYLASLMRLDDAGVIRFLRGETNWEHEARFRRSPLRPRDYSLQEPTQLFDVIWYGYVQAENLHSSEMRSHYTRLVESLKRPQKEAS